METTLIRPIMFLKPMLSTRIQLRMRAPMLSTSKILPSSCLCNLHTVVATEDSSGEKYKHTITSGSHTFMGDLGEAWGASGTAPEPKDYAFAGLAMCSSMTIRLYQKLHSHGMKLHKQYADRKKWPLRRVQVTVEEMGRGAGRLPEGLQMIVSLEGDLTDAQKERLVEVSANCPVKQMMLGKMPMGIAVHLSS